MHGPVRTFTTDGKAAGSTDGNRIDPRDLAGVINIDERLRKQDRLGPLHRQARLLRDEWRRRRYARLLDR